MKKEIEAIRNKLDSLENEEKWDEALKFIDEAMLKFPEEIHLYEYKDRILSLYSGEILDNEKNGVRIDNLDKMIELNPEDKLDIYDRADYYGGLHYLKSQILYDLGRYKEAITSLQSAIKLYPEDKEFLEGEIEARKRSEKE